MITVKDCISRQFDSLLEKRAVPSARRSFYKKWLRYYLDFCSKYHHRDASSKSLPLFLNKLREKKQTDMQITQAAHAVYQKMISFGRTFFGFSDELGQE